ncbi:hypothetical protein CRE_06903 [Caenorhabditis remanei]|uniref:Uncharacterized protein n=1 Tax=Caenorhabditis remanei TaxID=31234 RepID=E3MZJ4_CAERE|nr:hypothetical protein CRE_06903 [Caenorhabditis remanei]
MSEYRITGAIAKYKAYYQPQFMTPANKAKFDVCMRRIRIMSSLSTRRYCDTAKMMCAFLSTRLPSTLRLAHKSSTIGIQSFKRALWQDSCHEA